MMTGDATSEEYNAAIPPHPDPQHPEDDDEKKKERTNKQYKQIS